MWSVLIPWRPLIESRDRLRAWVERRWRAFDPAAEICYGQGPAEGAFNRSAALNEAFAASSGDPVVIADADTVFDFDTVRAAIDQTRQTTRWVLPYTVYYNLKPLETAIWLARSPESPLLEPEVWQHRLTDSVSGILVVPRAAYRTVGGFDERFVNWGGEDRAFASALTVLWTAPMRLPGAVLHLWHPEGLRFANPHWPANQALEAQYLDATTEAAMRALIEQRA